MSQADRSPRYTPLVPHITQIATAPSMCSVVYRSQAVTALSGYELYELVQAAQKRNQAESVTGLMLYDNARFYQWLEGPPANVAKIMNSIMSDRRHGNIEILSDRPIATRQFGDWTMRLASRGVRSINSGHNVTIPSRETFDELLRHPEQAPAILAAISPVISPMPPAAPFAAAEAAAPPRRKHPSNLPLHGAAAAMLKNVILSTVIPELLNRHGIGETSALWPIDARSRALADLLTGPDNGAALALIRTLQGKSGTVRQLYKTLVEPAARRLGDLWRDDLCSEFDVTLGLGQLQRAIRTLNEDTSPALPGRAILPAVLIVPEPGELHSFTANLDSDMLWNAGWDPQSEYPASDEALQDLVAGSWFDAMDLSLSASFRRERWLPRVSRTIALARHASRNPALVVVVAGRVFAEDTGATAQVGADGASTTAMDTELVIRAGLRHVHSD